MSVTVRGEPRERLRVTGDVERVLKLPYDDVEERFLLGFSDGTLIVGSLDEDSRYRFTVEIEGAALIRITREGEHDVLTLDFRIEWVVVSAYQHVDSQMDVVSQLSLLTTEERLRTLEAELEDQIPW